MYYLIPTIWHSGKGKNIETIKKMRSSKEVGRDEDVGT
jgi:hypothetical protein